MTSLGLAEQLLSVEGWFAFVFCLAVYLWSTTSLGQRSFTHAWLFTSLKVLTPTADSVDSILKTFQVDNRKQSQQQQQQTLQSLTAEQRLAKLHFSVSTVKPGSMTVVAMYQRDATALWKTLESFVCCSGPGATDMRVGASTANLWRTVLLGGYRVLGARLDDQPTAYAALLNIYCACHSTLAALGTLVVVFTTWTSRLLTGLAIWWTTALGTQQVSPFMHYSNIPNAQPAIQELAVRCTLWLQLVDARVQATVESNLQWSVLAVRLALTALGSLLAFCLAEPLQALQYRLAYRWDLGDWDMGAQPSTIPFASFCKASFGPLFRRIAMVGVALLPVAILLSYSYTDPTVIRIRAEAGWLFNILLCSLIKPLLQDYLQEALLQVVGVLARSPDESDDDASSRISFPFTSRSENVVRMGSQLVKLPLLLPILLAAAHLCSSYTSSNSIYTSAYGGPLLDTKLTQNWEQEQALGLRSLVDQGTKTCPTSQKQSKVFASKRTVATVASISDPLQLLTASSATSGSLIQTLKVVQRLMKNHSTTKDSTELEVHLPALQNTLQALARHPFLTSSIVLPFLDFIGYVLCCLWTITFVQRFLSLWKPMRAMRLQSRKLTRLPVVIPSTVY